MALLTAQQISRYYELYADTDVVFTKEVISTVGLQTKNIFMKHVGSHIPCVIYSASMKGAKVIANVKTETFVRLQKASNMVALRFAFAQADRPTPLAFYVNSKVVGYSPYGKDAVELNFVSLAYPQRPPDDLITMLGQLLDTNVNEKKRHEERITVTTENVTRLRLRSNDAVVYIGETSRKCIIRDLSFSGCRLIITGAAEQYADRPASLHVELDDKSTVQLMGKVIRTESVSGREDIVAIAILFEPQKIPLSYKMRINDFLTAARQGGNQKPVAKAQQGDR